MKDEKSDDFKVGDTVVYPGHGVGEVTAVVTRKIGETQLKVYEMLIAESGVKVMVPVGQSGIRRVIDKKSIDKVLTILKDRKTKVDTQTWNRRSREYSLKLKTGSLFEIAKVLRDLYILKMDKELSFGEKQMFEKAKGLVVSEIAIVKSRSEDKVQSELDGLFA